MAALRATVLVVRFLLELGLLASLAVWGAVTGSGLGVWVLGLAAPAIAVVVWGTFVAPKAKRPVPVPVRVVIELVLFGAAAVGLASIGRSSLAIVFFALAFVVCVANAATDPARFDRSRPSP